MNSSAVRSPASGSESMAASAMGGVAAVDRAFRILAAFRAEDRSLSLAELAARTGLHKSTILRLIESMQRYDYLQRLQGGGYRIGPMPLMLGAIYQRSMNTSDVLMPLLTQLTKQTGETSTFFVLHESTRVCLLRIETRHEIREHVRPGDTFPLSRGSPGAVLSAFSGAKGDKFDQIRSDHYYIAYGDRQTESVGISAPVFGAAQALLGAITISGPRSRIALATLEAMRGPLLKATAHATRALGGDATPLERASTPFVKREPAVRRNGA